MVGAARQSSTEVAVSTTSDLLSSPVPSGNIGGTVQVPCVSFGCLRQAPTIFVTECRFDHTTGRSCSQDFRQNHRYFFHHSGACRLCRRDRLCFQFDFFFFRMVFLASAVPAVTLLPLCTEVTPNLTHTHYHRLTPLRILRNQCTLPRWSKSY